MTNPPPADACLRCGYDLRGIADDAPCPECGLLAGRSRMPSDELRHARPRWLATLSAGTWLTLLAWAMPAAGVAVVRDVAWDALRINPYRSQSTWLDPQVLVAFAVPASFLAVGLWLLTRPEGRPVADAAGRRLRLILRAFGFIPLLMVAGFGWARWSNATWLGGLPENAPLQALAALAPLPALTFLHLRRLARRALNPSLAEHCLIVGTAASLGLLAPLLLPLFTDRTYPWIRSDPYLMVAFGIVAAALLLFLWAGLALLRFAVAFARAGRAAKRAWAAADAAATIPPPH